MSRLAKLVGRSIKSPVNYPAAELRGILNALEPKANLLIMLIPNILSYNFCRYFVANRTDKVAVIPEFSSPKFFLYLGEFSKHHLCRYAFDYLYYPRWSILRWHNQKQMHMIIHCFHRIYFKFISLCDLTKYLFQSRRHSIAEQLPSIFWYPYKMVLQIIDAMFASSQWAHGPYCNRFSS